MRNRISRFGLIALFAAVFSASNAYALNSSSSSSSSGGSTTYNYYAQVTVSASPSGAGTVYVSTSTTKGSSQSATSDATTESGGSRTFYFWAEANSGYTFSNWSSTAGATSGDSTTASAFSKSFAASTTADGTQSYTYYANFVKTTYYGKASVSIASGTPAGLLLYGYGKASINTSNSANGWCEKSSSTGVAQGVIAPSVTPLAITYNSAPGAASASQDIWYIAEAEPGSKFLGWTTDSLGQSVQYTDNPHKETVSYNSTQSSSPTAATTLYAVFGPATYYGTAEASIYSGYQAIDAGENGGTVSVSTSSDPGTYGQSAKVDFQSSATPGQASATQSVTFFAKTNAGCVFAGWKELILDEAPIVSTDNPLTVSATYSSVDSSKPTTTKRIAVFHWEPDYLSFKAVDGSVTVGMTNAVVSLEYAASKSGPWTAIDFAGGATLTIPSGTTYYFRSTLAKPPTPKSTYGIGQFTMSGTGKIDAGGEVTSLIDATCAKTDVSSCQYRSLFWGCQNLRTPPALPAKTLVYYCYYRMFSGCTSLTTAPALPAMTLAEYCYYGMFEGCTSLTTAPALPVTTLAASCYICMFYNCTSLTTAPALPATTLAESCYRQMFENCRSLTSAPPALPATTLASSCYSSMFYNCTSLTTAPELPATMLTTNCYQKMFYACSKLNSVKVNFTDWAADQSATDNWLPDNVGTFVCPAGLDLTTRTTSTVPPKWNVGWDVGGAGSNVFASKDTTGTLTISGEGTIGSGKFTDAVKSQISSLVIGQGVTGAAPDAFAGMTLSSVTLPTSWTGVQYDGSGNWYGAQLPQTEVTLLSVAQRYPWNNIVDYTYSIENLIPTMTYKLVVALTVDGETKATTNDVTTTADGTYTKQLDLSSLFEDGAKDSAAKIKLSLIK